MTQPKNGPRQLGYRHDHDPEGPRRKARLLFLHALARRFPTVLDDLADVPLDDEKALDAWARVHHLSDAWCLAYARATRATWDWFPRCRRTWFDEDRPARLRYIGDAVWHVPSKGTVFVDEVTECSEPMPKRPLKDGEHFAWLARFQMGENYRSIVKDVGRDTGGVHEACRLLASMMGLTLRPTRRGRPRKAR